MSRLKPGVNTTSGQGLSVLEQAPYLQPLSKQAEYVSYADLSVTLAWRWHCGQGTLKKNKIIGIYHFLLLFIVYLHFCVNQEDLKKVIFKR